MRRCQNQHLSITEFGAAGMAWQEAFLRALDARDRVERDPFSQIAAQRAIARASSRRALR